LVGADPRAQNVRIAMRQKQDIAFFRRIVEWLGLSIMHSPRVTM
jgi:hypothetical protein